jgi:pyruvate/2-oxoglutarate dehydrogenase complex dihydrolipoamide dehydrogenase (E3) component
VKKSSGKIYDFIVIGGGSAGYTAAAEAVKLGLRTAVIEDAPRLGGLCILRGCMPSKALIASANRYQAVKNAGELGVGIHGQPRFHPRRVVARKRRLVEIFAKARRGEIASGGFKLIRGRARFLDDHTVTVSLSDNGPPTQLIAKAFLVATGSYIPEPECPGLAEIGYLTSDGILENQTPAASLIVLGDGPVGLEAAHYYSSIGSRVTLVSKHGQILDSADRDVAEALARALVKAGVKIIFHATVESARMVEGKKEIKLQVKGRAKSIRADEVIFATGRKSCIDGLGLESAGVKLTDDGHIEANAQQRTRRRNIFAAGDVCGPFEILHLAVQQGRIAARNAARHFGRLRGKEESMDYRLKLSGIFTEPQVAVLGLTEKKARERKIRVRVASYQFSEEGRAQIENEMHGFAKLICEAKSGKLLGAAIVGPSAVELVHEMVAVLRFGGSVENIADMPHYHPTLSEIWTFPAEKLSGRNS